MSPDLAHPDRIGEPVHTAIAWAGTTIGELAPRCNGPVAELAAAVKLEVTGPRPVGPWAAGTGSGPSSHGSIIGRASLCPGSR